MIKSLLDDEEPQEEESGRKGGLIGRRLQREEFVKIDLSDKKDATESEESIRDSIRTGIIPGPEPPEEVAQKKASPRRSAPSAAKQQSSGRTAELERKLKEIEEELRREKEREAGISQAAIGETPAQAPASTPAVPEQQSDGGTPSAVTDAKSSFTAFEPEPQSEVFRRSGLAWSAAIALFGSVVFMLVLGWFADLLLGTSPWGIVAGIVIGSAVGFLQFFRITSQILKPKPSDFDKVSLKTQDSVDDAGPDRGMFG